METSENEILEAVAVTQEISQGGEEEQNHFNRLPDEVIVFHIFGKIPEAKSLFSCYLLSKRFASLVLRSHTISFRILGWFPSEEDDDEIVDLMIAQFGRQPQDLPQIPSPYDVNSTIPLLRFVKEFKSLKHLNMEVPFSSHKMIRSSSIQGKFSTGTIFKWRAEFKNQRSESFILFLANSLSPLDNLDDDPDDNNHGGGELMHRIDEHEQARISMDSVIDALRRLILFADVAPILGNQLQSVVITDTIGQGKVDLLAELLAELPRSGRSSILTLGVTEREMKWKKWSASVVRLPSTGCVMKGVSFLEIEAGNFVDEDSDSVARNAFEGDEIFTEAVSEMLKKPGTITNHSISLLIAALNCLILDSDTDLQLFIERCLSLLDFHFNFSKSSWNNSRFVLNQDGHVAIFSEKILCFFFLCNFSKRAKLIIQSD